MDWHEYDWSRAHGALIVTNCDEGTTLFLQGDEAAKLEDELERALDHTSPDWAIASILEPYADYFE